MSRRPLAPGPTSSLRRARRGAGLAEILLAMVIFAAVATSYAAVSLRYATRMKTISAGAARSAAIAQYMNRFSAMPFTSLDASAGTFTTTTGSLPNTVVITVTGSGNTRTVRLVLTPTNGAIIPDTVVLTRVQSSTSNPLGP